MSAIKYLVLFTLLFFLPAVRFQLDCSQSPIFPKIVEIGRLPWFQIYRVRPSEYVKGCAGTCSASDIPTCNNPGVKCEISCCSSDYCNGASGGASTGAPGGAFTGSSGGASTGASVIARKCYECTSLSSFKDCDANRKEVSCPTSTTHCVIARMYTSSSAVYVKGCPKSCSASDIPACNKPGVKCEISCCSSDYCNEGSLGAFTGASVISRECYKCISTHSFKDCNAKRKPESCSTSQHCATVHAYKTSGKEEIYAKECAATCSPSDYQICKNPKYKCKVNCCSSDYCNGASGPVVSGILLITTFTASFMYLFGC